MALPLFISGMSFHSSVVPMRKFVWRKEKERGEKKHNCRQKHNFSEIARKKNYKRASQLLTVIKTGSITLHTGKYN